MMPLSKRKSRSRDDGLDSDPGGPMGPPRSGCFTESGSDLDGGKRIKLGTPKAAVKSIIAGTESARPITVISDCCSSDAERNRKKLDKDKMKKRPTADATAAGCGVVVEQLGAVRRELQCWLLKSSLKSDEANDLLSITEKFDFLVMDLIEERGFLEGELKTYQKFDGMLRACGVAAVKGTVAGNAAPVSVSKIPVAKPVDTWSVVVKGGGGSTSKEVVGKVVEHVAPVLGVRVHGVKPIRDGGAVIRTPSVAERQKIVANEKFKEVGLEVSVMEKLGPRLLVQGVHKHITLD